MDQERTWIARAQRGDQAAFGQLVQVYERPVYNLAYRMLGDPTEAEDAAQETFVRAYRALSTYEPERKFVNWLLSIASHYCIDRLRQKGRSVPISLDGPLPDEWLASDMGSPEQQVSAKEEREQVHQILEMLPPAYRAAVILRYWHDMSYQEIATVMSTSESAIKSRLHRARLLMARQFQQLHGVYTSDERRRDEGTGVCAC